MRLLMDDWLKKCHHHHKKAKLKWIGSVRFGHSQLIDYRANSKKGSVMQVRMRVHYV
jgi:hypothetical protein